MDKGDTSQGYQYGRLTKDACRGFLAKVYLWLGSVAQRDGKEILGNAADNFGKSLEYSSTVIQGGRYKLVDYYPDVFNAKTRDKAPDEVLWCVQGLTGDDTGTWTGMMFGIRGSQNLGGSWDNISSSDYHRMIYEPSDSIRRLWNCPRMTIQEDGTLWGWDYKMYWDTRGDQKLSEATENNNWLQWSIGKFRRFPLADPSSYNYTNFGMDEPLLRYADVLLMYAEAYNEVNHGPGDYRPSSGIDMSGISVQSAYDAVNLVRKRSRIANEGIMHQDVLPRKLITDYINKVDECVPDWKPNSYGYIYDGVRTVWDYNRYGDDYTAFRTEILNERARELVAESTDRWCDLVRRGTLVKQMQVWRQYNPFISNTEREITTPGAPENIQVYNDASGLLLNKDAAIEIGTQKRIVMPQALAQDAYFKIKYNLTTTIAGGGTDTQLIEKDILIKNVTPAWYTNNDITYTLIISLGTNYIEFDTSVTDWVGYGNMDLTIE